MTDDRRAQQLERALAGSLQGELRFDVASRAMYANDASVYEIIPLGVVMPRSVEDVVRTVAICREHGVSITARGGGTSQAGQAIGAGIVIDFSKYMRRTLALDADAGTVTVEPGMVLDELNTELTPHGWALPLDLSTASRATIGGMISNNSSGTRSIVYGSTIDYVLELEVLLADGSIVTLGARSAVELDDLCARDDLAGRCYRTVRGLAAGHADEISRRYPKIRRRVGGYNLDRFVAVDDGFDLCKLIVGSEGTLAMVLKATMRLVRPRKAAVLAVAHFETVRLALEATPAILRHDPSAVELLDRKLLAMTRGKPDFEPLRQGIVGDPGAVLIVEFSGDDPARLLVRIDELERDLAARPERPAVTRAIDAASQARIWKLRQAGLGLTVAQVGDRKGVSFVEDTAVPVDRLADYIDRFQRILDAHGTDAFFYAHASVGLLHIRPTIDMKTTGGVAHFEAIASEIADLVLEFGGALSAEHGDGLVRAPFQERMYGPELYAAFREIKRTFDSGQLFNPGKIVDAPALTDSLKFGPSYPTNPIETVLDFSDFGGLSRAAEQCGGVGACRKTLTATMCPSYMATREEADSTRGRANALRLAIAGRLGPDGFTDNALHPVMDLCLECKACKTECPTGVDMARMKSEFLHQYQRVHGVPLRSRVLAETERTAAWGSRLAPLSNLAAGNPISRWLGDWLLGLDRRRAPPAFARPTFLDWWKSRSNHGGIGAIGEAKEGATVAVFADTFSNYYEPEHGRSVVRLAEKLGHRVVVAPRVCCGRPLISKGLLDRARAQAEATTAALLPLADAGLPIVFCEPGCYSAVRDDHPLLLRGETRARADRVARACVTFEEWAETAFSNGREVRFAENRPTRLLLHGHCHQKALVGIGPAMRLLSRIPGCQVVDADAGCCGMAGSFGYEREHYEVSKAVGERRLFPAVRDQKATVVAPGFSCRHQIRHFTGIAAVSPMRLLDGIVR
jgi:FAD/FMN-containing dehydrogenase/Fe-S oxidoreductase